MDAFLVVITPVLQPVIQFMQDVPKGGEAPTYLHLAISSGVIFQAVKMIARHVFGMEMKKGVAVVGSAVVAVGVCLFEAYRGNLGLIMPVFGENPFEYGYALLGVAGQVTLYANALYMLVYENAFKGLAFFSRAS